MDNLERIPQTVRNMILDAKDEGERVDILGRVNWLEGRLKEERRLAVTEIDPGTEGKIYRMEQGRVGTRTYNSTSLFAKFADRWGVSILQAIGHLMSQDVIRIEWRWTNFKKIARDLGIDYTLVQREITDGDIADVGETWKDGYPSFKAINKEA